MSCGNAQKSDKSCLTNLILNNKPIITPINFKKLMPIPGNYA